MVGASRGTRTSIAASFDDPDVRLITTTGVVLAEHLGNSRLAVRFEVGRNADLVRLEVDGGGTIVGAVPAFGGVWRQLAAASSMAQALGRPQTSTVWPGVFAALDPYESWEGIVMVPSEKLRWSRHRRRQTTSGSPAIRDPRVTAGRGPTRSATTDSTSARNRLEITWTEMRQGGWSNRTSVS